MKRGRREPGPPRERTQRTWRGVASGLADATLPVSAQRGLAECLRSQAPISVLSVQQGAGHNLCSPEVSLLVERDQK